MRREKGMRRGNEMEKRWKGESKGKGEVTKGID